MKTFGTCIFVSGLLAFGCSNSTDGGETNATGGSVGVGGATGIVTSPTVGGSTTNPGTAVTGGASSSSQVVGGAGGSTSTGSNVTGGTTSTGGKSSVGGTSGKGGTTAAGGSSDPGIVVKVCDVSTAGTLKAAAACNNKLIGAAIASGQLSNSGYTGAASDFNFFTAENEMKWDTVESSQNSFNFAPGDTVANFASSKGGKLKGHTLVWHSQLPSWVGSASDVKAAMINHITKTMTQYKGKVFSWDVVNEAVYVTDKSTGMGNAKLRDNSTGATGDHSPFVDKVGKDYIDIAFQTAHQVDPGAKLFYNDYSSEGMNDKSNFIYEMVKSMKDRGIPIDGVGMQMHIGTPNATVTAAQFKQNIDRLAALGLEIQISEFDINGCDAEKTDAYMATTYHEIVAACVAQPKCTAITFWGINDGGSWLNGFAEAKCNGKSARALLFTDSFAKKAVYNSVRDALIGK
jgi:endo-1,4-beta-xylanase